MTMKFNKVNAINFLTTIAFIFALKSSSTNGEESSRNAVGDQRLALDLLRVLKSETTSNLLISPSLLYRNLALLRLGTKGADTQQLKKIFNNLENNQVAIHAGDALKHISHVRVNSINYAANVEFNSLWMTRATNKFGFTTRNIETFAELPNQWIAMQTNDEIKNFINTREIGTDTNVMILETLNFTSDWEYPFQNITTNYFSNSNSAMHKIYSYHKEQPILSADLSAFGINSRAFMLPFKQKNTGMFILLPSQSYEIDEVLDQFLDIGFWQVLPKLELANQRIFLPKMKLRIKTAADDALSNLGITDIYSDRAKFRHMVHQNSKVMSIQHEVILENSMKGITATAVSSIQFVKHPVLEYRTKHGKSPEEAGSKTIEYADIDQPFYFAIIADRNILFEGVIRKLNKI